MRSHCHWHRASARHHCGQQLGLDRRAARAQRHRLYFQVKVGDNFGRIEASIRQALERSDAVICCGGLGPTQDDITRDVIAQVMGVGMQRDAAIADKIRRIFEARGRVMSPKQSAAGRCPDRRPADRTNARHRPGLVCPLGAKVIYAVPGVPSEMREMMLGSILPDLRQRAGQSAVIRSRVLRTWGMSRSGLAEVLAERMAELDQVGNPTIAYQASGIDGIKVRLVAKCKDEATAAQVPNAEEALIRRLLGDVIFGIDEVDGGGRADGAQGQGHDTCRRRGSHGRTVGGAHDDGRSKHGDLSGARIASATGEAEMAGLSARAAAAADVAQREFASTVGAAAMAGPARQAGGPVTAPVVLAARIGDRRQHEELILPADRGRLRDFAVISLLNMLRKALTS